MLKSSELNQLLIQAPFKDMLIFVKNYTEKKYCLSPDHAEREKLQIEIADYERVIERYILTRFAPSGPVNDQVFALIGCYNQEVIEKLLLCISDSIDAEELLSEAQRIYKTFNTIYAPDIHIIGILLNSLFSIQYRMIFSENIASCDVHRTMIKEILGKLMERLKKINIRNEYESNILSNVKAAIQFAENVLRLDVSTIRNTPIVHRFKLVGLLLLQALETGVQFYKDAISLCGHSKTAISKMSTLLITTVNQNYLPTSAPNDNQTTIHYC